MSDATLPSPPHLPRWSKTAAIVVLVVFSLVVIVALFGLWAFAERRDADAERDHANALDFAAHLVDDAHGEVRASLSEALRGAAAARDAGSLWQVLRSERSLVRHICRYTRDEFFWVDDQFLLHLPDKALQAWAHRQHDDVEDAIESRNRLDAMTALPEQQLAAWTEHVRDYPVVAKSLPGEQLWLPTALEHVTGLLAVASKVPGDRAPWVLRDALFAAQMAERLNRGRTDLSPEDRDRLSGQIQEKLTTLRRSLPEDTAPYVRWEFERFVAVQSLLADPEQRRPIENAVRAARGVASRPGAGQVQLHYAQPDVVAIVADENDPLVLTVLQLEPEGLRRYIEAELRSARWHTPGFELQLKAEDTTDVVSERSLADLETQWNLPFSVVVIDKPEPLLGTTTDWFYWGIIVLACVGMLIGGWVLVRLLTRQVRLAELKADFVSNLSHELKTPITSIGLFAEMLKDGKLETDEDRAEAYGVIAHESDRLKHTVARMLGIARRAASRSPYRMQPGDLNRPVRDAVERFQRLVTDDGLTLEVQLAERPLPMTLDEDAIGDVATNLLNNAWNYKRGEAARIRIRTARRRGKAVLEVADNGIGVPRSERKRIFQMFYRSEQYLSQGVSGTGLGLALVRTVVKGHHGRIRVLDGLGGKGSTFEATFPLSAHDPGVTEEPDTARSDGQTRVVHESTGRRSKQTSDHRRTSGPAAEHS